VTPEQILALADKLSGASLAALLILVLWLGSTRRWVWGYQLQDCEARRVADVLAARERELEWKAIAHQGLAAAKTGLEVAKDRTP
jgi:hypothetical protein